MILKSESPILSSEKSFNQALTHDRSSWREGDGEQEKKSKQCEMYIIRCISIGYWLNLSIR